MQEYCFVVLLSCLSIQTIHLRASPNSLANLVWVEIVVHQLVDNVVRVLVDKLQAHWLNGGSDIATNLSQPVSNILRNCLKFPFE